MLKNLVICIFNEKYYKYINIKSDPKLMSDSHLVVLPLLLTRLSKLRICHVGKLKNKLTV